MDNRVLSGYLLLTLLVVSIIVVVWYKESLELNSLQHLNNIIFPTWS